MAITSLLDWSHNPLTPAYVLMGAAAVSLAVLIPWPPEPRSRVPAFSLSCRAGADLYELYLALCNPHPALSRWERANRGRPLYALCAHDVTEM